MLYFLFLKYKISVCLVLSLVIGTLCIHIQDETMFYIMRIANEASLRERN